MYLVLAIVAFFFNEALIQLPTSKHICIQQPMLVMRANMFLHSDLVPHVQRCAQTLQWHHEQFVY